MCNYVYMAIGAPKDITQCRSFFAEPSQPRQRMYEALRAYFLEDQPSQTVARNFGYSPGAFRVLCHQFRRDPDPQFFVTVSAGANLTSMSRRQDVMRKACCEMNVAVAR